MGKWGGMSQREVTLDELTDLCLRRGFVFPSGRIYGGLSGFFDYGPLGVELARNVLNDWWRWFVETRDDILTARRRAQRAQK